MKYQKIKRKQLDELFTKISNATSVPEPKEGWIREIRVALGMSMFDLANRLGVIKQRIERIEKDELEGKLTIETLKRTAEAMNCELKYFLVPKTSLSKTVEEQAMSVARSIVDQTNTSMIIENQKPSKSSQGDLVEEIYRSLLNENERKIWKNSINEKKS